MDDLSWRPLVLDDLDAIVELSQICYAADGGLGFLFAPEIVRDRYLPDDAHESLGGFDSGGHLAASASVYLIGSPDAVRIRMVGQVRPDLRSRGIGGYLMRWSQEHARALPAGDARVQPTLQVATESLAEPAHRLYLAYGFARVFDEYVMERDLRRPLPEISLPADVTLATWQPDLAEKFYQAYYAAFRQRPGFPGYRAAEWIGQVNDNDHRPEWSFLASAGDEPAGFVIGNMDLTTDPMGGYIWQIGVVPSQRRRGLASALLVETMRRMQAAGVNAALLTVHLNNPGAIAAYLNLGFKVVGRRARYEKGLDMNTRP